MPPLTGEQKEAFARMLGDEIRKARKDLRWTRAQLRDALLYHTGEDLSVQTLGTWELGTRAISAIRLVEVCMVLDVPVHELLRRASVRTFGDPVRDAPGYVEVDLRALSSTSDPRLYQLRQWAAVRLYQRPIFLYSSVESLGRHAIDALAALTGIDEVELLRALLDLANDAGS